MSLLLDSRIFSSTLHGGMRLGTIRRIPRSRYQNFICLSITYLFASNQFSRSSEYEYKREWGLSRYLSSFFTILQRQSQSYIPKSSRALLECSCQISTRSRKLYLFRRLPITIITIIRPSSCALRWTTYGPVAIKDIMRQTGASFFSMDA